MRSMIEDLIDRGYIWGKKRYPAPPNVREAFVFDIQEPSDWFHANIFTAERPFSFDDVPCIAPLHKHYWCEYRLRDKYFPYAEGKAEQLGMRMGCGLSSVDLKKDDFPYAYVAEREGVREECLKLYDKFTEEDGFSPDAAWGQMMNHTSMLRSHEEISDQDFRLIITHILYSEKKIKVRWMLTGNVYVQAKGKDFLCMGNVELYVHEHGQLVPITPDYPILMDVEPAMEDWLNNTPLSNPYSAILGCGLMPTLTAMTWSHSKNVTIIETDQPPQWAKAFAKKKGRKPAKVHTLYVQPARRDIRRAAEQAEQEPDPNRPKRKITKRIQHYKHFGPKWGTKLLFGRVEGVFVWSYYGEVDPDALQADTPDYKSKSLKDDQVPTGERKVIRSKGRTVPTR